MATQSVKDILNTEVPKPSFVLSPSVSAPLPSGVTVTRNGQDNVARTLDPYSGKFEQVGEDTPRVYGSDQSLLVEAVSRKNHVNYSSDITKWFDDGTGVSRLLVPSVISGGAAEQIGSSSGSGQIINGSGAFSSGTETASFIAEVGTATQSSFVVENRTDRLDVAEVIYSWSTDSFTTVGTDRVNVRTLPITGPNTGGRVIRVVFSYSGGTSGDTRTVEVRPASDGNGGNIKLHHAQLEEASRASSPTVTNGSTKTRAADSYTIFNYSNDPDQDYPDYWNPNEGTFFVKFRARTHTFDVGNSDMAVLAHSGGGQGLKARNGFSGQDTYRVQDSSGNSVSAGTVTDFEVDDVALSLTGSEFRLSVNGSSASGNANGNFASTSQLNIGSPSLSRLIGEIHSLRYIPRALPESTLNTLTS